VFKSLVRQATGCGSDVPVAGFQLWVWGLKNDSMNDCRKSPLEEKVFAVIPLVPLFVSFLYD
jgi:hypothetical protein